MTVKPKNRVILSTGSMRIHDYWLFCTPMQITRILVGILPDWHMNKAHWLSVAQDGPVENEKFKFLVDMSYGLT